MRGVDLLCDWPHATTTDVLSLDATPIFFAAVPSLGKNRSLLVSVCVTIAD